MPGVIKNVKDFKYALVFFSKQSRRLEVELFTNEKSREARRENLNKAKIDSMLGHVNRT